MRLSQFCIHRPVFTIVLSLILMVVGIIGYQRLPIRQNPGITPPVLSIMTTYSGASAELVETQITTPIEEILGNIDGLETVQSTSSQGESKVTLRFELGTDMLEATNQVRDKLGMLANQLPDGAYQPILLLHDPDEANTVIFSFTASHKSSMALSDYITRYVKPQFEQIDGASSVDIFGGGTYAMRMWLDPAKMAIRDITTNDVIQALTNENKNVPGGQIKSIARDYGVLTHSNLVSVKAFNDLIIRNTDGYLIRFSDIGRAVVGSEDEENLVRVNQKPSVAMTISTKSTANPIEVADKAVQLMNQVEQDLPEGMSVTTVYNNADFVHASLQKVYHAIIEAIILVILIVFLFLGSIRATLIPIVTIPICLIAVFGFMYTMGYSINVFTLFALVLAIGLVVDDAIMMLENIYRHVESGMPVMEAAIKGSHEIGFAIIAMTITLAAVYTPIGFIPGMTGIVFREFAFTLAVVVIISGFVALTLSPMMCARLVQHNGNKYIQWLQASWRNLLNGYKHILSFILDHRIIIFGVLIGILLAGFFLFKSLPAELSPVEDNGVLMVEMNTPTNASFNYIDYYVRLIEKDFMAVPELSQYVVFVDDTGGFSFIILKPWYKRSHNAQEITAVLSKKLADIPGATAIVLNPMGMGVSGKHGGALRIELMTTSSYKQLSKVMDRLVEAAEKNPHLRNPSSDLKMDSEQFDITINRNLAASLGVDIQDISQTISTLLGGSWLTSFDVGDQSYRVVLQVKKKKQREISNIQQFYVRSSAGQMIPLSSLVSVNDKVGPLALVHYNRLRSAEFSAQLQPGYEMSKAINFVRKMTSTILPSDFKYAFEGDAKNYLESSHSMAMLFGLALLFIYLVLAAQFESFIDPFIILTTVPLCIIGAFFTLKLTGGSLNLYSNIGFVTLVGLISKHGILITEFSNQLRARGKPMREALIEAASLRLRPILMTTAAMIIGAMPLALATGPGSEARHQIGWVIAGGLFFGTFFSLIVVPVAYTFLAKNKVYSSR